jgi:hypothetical protein
LKYRLMSHSTQSISMIYIKNLSVVQKFEGEDVLYNVFDWQAVAFVDEDYSVSMWNSDHNQSWEDNALEIVLEYGNNFRSSRKLAKQCGARWVLIWDL